MASASKRELLDALSDSDVFGALTEEELGKLLTFGSTLRFAQNQTIFQKGDPGDSMMIVVHGRVKISSMSYDGREALLAFIEPGSGFGEIALLDGKPRSADATAVNHTDLFVIKRRDLMRYLDERADIAIRIIGLLCQRLRHTTEKIEDVVLLHMGPRIAKALLRLSQDYGRKHRQGILIDLKLSQRDLGSYVGLARENVNRQLASWKQSGIVAIDGSMIVICDEARLNKIAQESG